MGKMIANASEFREVSKLAPCPVCEKPNWCRVSDDGCIECHRPDVGYSGYRLLKKTASGYNLLRRVDDLTPRSNGQAHRNSKPKHAYGTLDGAILGAASAIQYRQKQAGETIQAKHAHTWTYRTSTGEYAFSVARFNTADGKQFRPIHRDGNGFVLADPPGALPLYRLPEISNESIVYVVEGEKCADAGAAIGLTCTTSAHGSKAAHKSDWPTLAGKDVVLIPDNDTAGLGYAETVATILTSLNNPATVKIVELPGLPAGGDVIEFIAAQRNNDLSDDAIRKAIETLVDAAEVIEFDRPVPSIEPYRPFPVEALPEPARSFVTDGANALGCDASYVALPLLAGLASAIGNTRRIQLKSEWTGPSILWVAIVGDSGTMKSPAIELALQPIRDRQRKAMRQYGEKIEAYQIESAVYDRASADWKRSKGETGPPTKPKPPIADRCWCDDTTIESLAVLLQNQWRGLLVVRDELSGWVASFDRYAQGKGGDVAKWLEMYGARSMVIDRKTGSSPTISIDRASVCLVGGIQPGVLRRSLGTQHRENGLAARLLMAYPPRIAKRWTEASIAPATRAAMDDIFGRLFGLDPDRDDSGDLTPRSVTLTHKGQRAWTAFYNEHNAESAELTGDLAAVASKIEEYAARLALVVHFVRWAAGDPALAGPEAVDEESIAAGVMLARWFMREARRVYGILSESDDDGRLRQLIELIERKGGEVTTRELIRSSRMFADTAGAKAALEKLVAADYGCWEQASPGSRGGKPSKRFVLTCGAVDTSTVDNTPCFGSANGGIVDVDTVATRNTTSLMTGDNCEILAPSRTAWAEQ